MSESIPKGIVFFIDRCLGRNQLAEALRKRGVRVEVHDAHFSKDALDVDWLPNVGERGWIVLTKDSNIGRCALERIAVTNANIKMFVLASQNLSGVDMIDAFSRALSKIINFVRDNSAPFITKVYRDGQVKEWKTATDLQAELQQSSDD
ncbi:MAG: hypothetical protein NZ772_06560 [Cyanobacteria bacterium]|nr:hypothetical protein [Cyanobacteriota bacterium]MDW8201152.1 hypothetical protein [Cyanobacteriota bacterium SKYGB_h_bin112]